jgi:uncharacterized membrane protein
MLNPAAAGQFHVASASNTSRPAISYTLAAGRLRVLVSLALAWSLVYAQSDKMPVE